MNWSNSLWEACQSYRRDASKDCDNPMLMNLTAHYYALYVVIVYSFGVGLVNNCLTALFIFQKKYNDLCQATLLRFFFISNIVFTLSGVVYMIYRMKLTKPTDELYNIAFFISGTALLFSDALLALMAITRFVYTVCPNLVANTSSQLQIAQNVCIFVLLVLSAFIRILIVWYGFDPYLRKRAWIYLSVLLIAVVFNIVSILIERRQTRSEQLRSFSRQLDLYIALSIVLFAVTTTPYFIINLVPYDTGMTLSCEFCQDMLTTHMWFDQLMMSNCLMDNLLFCVASKTYRTELKSILSKFHNENVKSLLTPMNTPGSLQSFMGYLAHGDDRIRLGASLSNLEQRFSTSKSKTSHASRSKGSRTSTAI